MGKQRTVTHQQAETKKEQAATLMERIGEPERASDYRDMSVEEYAEGRAPSMNEPRGTVDTRRANARSGSKNASDG